MNPRSYLGALLLCVLPCLTAMLAGCSDAPAPPRKMQTVKLLPDTPPPPPPPPKPEDKRPEPKREDKPQPQVQQPKPEPQQQQALKTDEAAGTGPGNGLVAGAVTQDYTDQKVGQGVAVGSTAPADPGPNRMVATLFARQTTRALNEFLAREREVKRNDYQVRVDLWLTPSGSLQRADLVGSTGDTALDEALRLALTRFPGAGTPPDKLPQPLRLLVSNRLLG
jgi:periplasmic protein TonB